EYIIHWLTLDCQDNGYQHRLVLAKGLDSLCASALIDILESVLTTTITTLLKILFCENILFGNVETAVKPLNCYWF
ncbi:2732_t:CDS:2, partial [Entrophospora sp. SA101]